MESDYKRLRDEWYAKLKKDGFEDIEDVNSPREFLKQWHSTWFKSMTTPETFKERHRYFQHAVYFSTTYTFKSKLEERVWCMHSEGHSYRDIAKSLKTNKDRVNKIITRLLKIMRGY